MSMATDGVRNFFPALFSLPSPDSLTSGILNFVFPEHPYVPTIHLKVPGLSTIEVKRPLVAVTAVTGFLVFMDAGRRVVGPAGKQNHFRGAFSFGMAMCWYSFMCIGGFWYDSISHHQFFYGMDVVGTACCSVSVIAGSMGLDDRVRVSRLILGSVYVLVAATFISGSSVTREFMYIVPSTLALIPASLILCRKIAERLEKKRKEEIKVDVEAEEIGWWMLVARVGTMVALGGLLLNRWITPILGQHFCETLCFFLGSHAAVLGTVRMVLASNRTESLAFS